MTADRARRRSWWWLIAAGVLIAVRAVTDMLGWDLFAPLVTGAFVLCVITSMHYSGWVAGYHARERERR